MSPLLGMLDDGGIFRTVAPVVRFPSGKYECLMSVSYNADGVPVSGIIGGEGREIMLAEVELIDALPELQLPK